MLAQFVCEPFQFGVEDEDGAFAHATAANDERALVRVSHEREYHRESGRDDVGAVGGEAAEFLARCQRAGVALVGECGEIAAGDARGGRARRASAGRREHSEGRCD